MNTYKIEITETLQKIVDIEAKNDEEAYNIVREKYKNEELILTDKDFVDTEIKVYKEK
jgi:hypothetical protein